MKQKKSGFSLAETLISMLILSIFFGAAAKMVTHRPKNEVVVNPHGYYECFYDGDVLYSKGTGRSGETKEESGICSFSPARDSSVYDIGVILANGKGVRYKTVSQMNYNLEFTVPTIEAGKNYALITNTDETDDNKECVSVNNSTDHPQNMTCSTIYSEISLEDYKSEIKLVNPSSRILTSGTGENEANGGIYISW